VRFTALAAARRLFRHRNSMGVIHDYSRIEIPPLAVKSPTATSGRKESRDPPSKVEISQGCGTLRLDGIFAIL